MGKHIVVIPGDGIGREVTDGAVEILKKIDEIYHLDFTYVNGRTPAARPMTNTACPCRRKRWRPAGRGTASSSAP